MKTIIISILIAIITAAGAVSALIFDNFHLGFSLYGLSIVLMGGLVLFDDED